MTDEETRALRPQELAALRVLADPHPGYAPPLDTVALLLRRGLVTIMRGKIEITRAGCNLLAADQSD